VVETTGNTSAESLGNNKSTTAETTALNADELADELSIAPTEPVTPVNSSYRYAETTLLGLSGEAKALQLVVFSNENALNSFKQSYPQLQTYTYARTKNGQKQLVVVLAPFSDHAAAKAQINKLPAAFQNAFVKAISEIHSEISTN
jgi:septal ring-binding cell division protein DamX